MYNDFVRVQKRIARKLFNQGYKVTICPCKYNVYNEYWCCKETIHNKQYENMDFDKIVNAFTYYCCNNELGSYPAYYVSKYEYKPTEYIYENYSRTFTI